MIRLNSPRPCSKLSATGLGGRNELNQPLSAMGKLALILDALVWGWLALIALYLVTGRLDLPNISGLDFSCLGLAATLVLRFALKNSRPLNQAAWQRVFAWLRARPMPTTLLLTGLWALVIWLYALARHYTFNSTEDLAVHLQGLWTLLRGELYYSSLRQMSHWGEHFNPTMLLTLPVYALSTGPGSLLLIQTLAMAAGAPAIMYLVYQKLEPAQRAWGLALVFLYLSNPGLWATVTFDFHPIALAGGLWLWFFALRERKPGLAWLFAGLALGCGEESWAVLAGYGLYLALAEKRPWQGLVILLLAVAGFLMVIKLVVPHFNLHAGAYYYTERFAALGGGFSGHGELGDKGGGLAAIAWNLISNPGLVWQVLSMPGKGSYVLILFVWVLFLPILRPWTMLWFLPVLGGVLVSSYPPQWSLHQHYTACILPGMYASSVLGLARLLAWPPIKKVRPGPLLGALSLALLIYVDASPMGLVWTWAKRQPQAIDRILEEVPPEAAVAASKSVLPHLALRWGLYQLTGFPERTPWVIVCDKPNPWPFTAEENQELVVELQRQDYAIVKQDGPCTLLRHPSKEPMHDKGKALTPHRHYK